MKLHENRQLFADAVRVTSETMGIAPEFVEKDYWICQILQNLSRHQDSGSMDADLRTSILFTGFNSLWQKIAPQYQTEVGALSYGEMPDKEEIATSTKELLELVIEIIAKGGIKDS